MSAVIQLNNIFKTYQSGETLLHALENVTLSIFSGELVAVMGESGSGKSTLLNIIGLLDHPDKGTYELNGIHIHHMTDDEFSAIRNRQIGFIFQSFFLLPRLTALQNIAMPLLYRGISRHEAKEHAMEMLKKIKIERLAHHKPNQMSGGQQQRVALCRALIGDPAVILADEPTGALDSHTRQEVMDLFKQLNKEDGKTIVIVTHDHHIGDQCSRRVSMEDGYIIEDKKG